MAQADGGERFDGRAFLDQRENLSTARIEGNISRLRQMRSDPKADQVCAAEEWIDAHPRRNRETQRQASTSFVRNPSDDKAPSRAQYRTSFGRFVR